MLKQGINLFKSQTLNELLSSFTLIKGHSFFLSEYDLGKHTQKYNYVRD